MIGYPSQLALHVGVLLELRPAAVLLSLVDVSLKGLISALYTVLVLLHLVNQHEAVITCGLLMLPLAELLRQ